MRICAIIIGVFISQLVYAQKEVIHTTRETSPVKEVASGVNIAPLDTSRTQGNSFSGIVMDEKTKTPLENATIYIPDLKLGLVTDEKGSFRFVRLPRGSYVIEVKLSGYKSQAKNIQINGDINETFLLKEDFVEGSDVVVTGFSKAMQIKRNPIPVIAVSHDYISHNLSTNAMDILAKVPGLRTVTTGPNVSKPFIRGLGYNRILTLYDGIRQEGQQWGDEHGIEIDEYAVEKLEVIKGPASLSYGSDALAGVVNIIPTQPAPEGTLKGNIVTEYQTNNGQFGGSAMLGATKNGIEWQGRVSHRQATNYQNKYDGRVFGTGFNETDANASVGLHRKWGYSHLHLIMYDNKQEIPNGARDSATRKFTRQIGENDDDVEIVSDKDLKSYKIENIHQRVQHYRAYLNNNFVFNNGSRLGVNLGFQRSIRREFEDPVEYTVPGLYLQLNSYTYDFKYYFPEVKGWNITTGVNGMYQVNNSNDGTEFVIPSYKQFDIGPFLMAKKSIGNWEFAGGIRYDIRNFKNDELYVAEDPVTGFERPVSGLDTVGAEKLFNNYKKTFSGLSASVGGSYTFNEKLSLKINISKGYRAPNISEISANGVHPGTNIYQLGNDNFKAESSLQEDIGLEYTSKQLVISFSLFNNNINNYIFNQKLTTSDGSDSIIVPGNETYQYQSSRAHLYGGEIGIDIHPWKALHFENNFSMVYGINRGVKGGKPVSEDAKDLPLIAPAHGISELRYDFNYKPLSLVNGFIKAQLEYSLSQNKVFSENGTETPTPGYALFNAGIGAGIANSKGKSICNVYLMANNLFNTAYQDHLSRLKYMEPYPNNFTGRNGIYNMGRNVSIKLEFPLSWNL